MLSQFLTRKATIGSLWLTTSRLTNTQNYFRPIFEATIVLPSTQLYDCILGLNHQFIFIAIASILWSHDYVLQFLLFS